MAPSPPHCTLSMQVLSRDSVTVSVDAVVYYRVKNPIMATNNVEYYRLEMQPPGGIRPPPLPPTHNIPRPMN